MPPTCSICRHPQRKAIDKAIALGTPLRDIAGRYGTSSSALDRHKTTCLGPAVRKAVAKRADLSGETVLKQVVALQKETFEILDLAKASARLSTAVMAIGAAQKNLELIGKLTGELDERAMVNILVTPQWAAVEEALTRALAPYPQILEAVRAELATVG